MPIYKKPDRCTKLHKCLEAIQKKLPHGQVPFGITNHLRDIFTKLIEAGIICKSKSASAIEKEKACKIILLLKEQLANLNETYGENMRRLREDIDKHDAHSVLDLSHTLSDKLVILVTKSSLWGPIIDDSVFINWKNGSLVITSPHRRLEVPISVRNVTDISMHITNTSQIFLRISVGRKTWEIFPTIKKTNPLDSENYNTLSEEEKHLVQWYFFLLGKYHNLIPEENIPPLPDRPTTPSLDSDFNSDYDSDFDSDLEESPFVQQPPPIILGTEVIKDNVYYIIRSGHETVKRRFSEFFNLKESLKTLYPNNEVVKRLPSLPKILWWNVENRKKRLNQMLELLNELYENNMVNSFLFDYTSI